MQSGMMWYDNDPKKDGPTKLAEAIARFVDKFDELPDCAHVNADDLPKFQGCLDFEIVADRWIRPGFIWVGVDLEPPPEPTIKAIR